MLRRRLQRWLGEKRPLDERLNGLFKEPLEFKDGHITVPQKPGLGYAIDRDAVDNLTLRRF